MKKIFLSLLMCITFVIPCLSLIACDQKDENISVDETENYEISVEVEDKRNFELYVEEYNNKENVLVITDGLDNYGYIEMTKEEENDSSNYIVSFNLYVSVFTDSIDVFINNEKEEYNTITSDDGFYNCLNFEYLFNSDLVVELSGNFEIL